MAGGLDSLLQVGGSLLSSAGKSNNSSNAQQQDPRGISISIFAQSYAQQSGITDKDQLQQLLNMLASCDGCDNSQPDGFLNSAEQAEAEQQLGGQQGQQAQGGGGLSKILDPLSLFSGGKNGKGLIGGLLGGGGN